MNRKSINNLLIASRHPGEGKMLHCDESFDIPFSKDSDKCVSMCDGGMMKTKNKKKKKTRKCPRTDNKHDSTRRSRHIREMQMTHEEGQVSDVMSGPIKDRRKAERRKEEIQRARLDIFIFVIVIRNV